MFQFAKVHQDDENGQYQNRKQQVEATLVVLRSWQGSHMLQEDQTSSNRIIELVISFENKYLTGSISISSVGNSCLSGRTSFKTGISLIQGQR